MRHNYYFYKHFTRALLLFLQMCFVFFCACGGYSHLHVRVGEATSRQVVCVHGHWLLLGSQVLILVQRQRIHWAFVVQAPLTEKKNILPKKKKTTHTTFGSSKVVKHSPTSYSTARGCVGAGHHPGARHCHSMLLINIKRQSWMSRTGTARWIKFIRHN